MCEEEDADVYSLTSTDGESGAEPDTAAGRSKAKFPPKVQLSIIAFARKKLSESEGAPSSGGPSSEGLDKGGKGKQSGEGKGGEQDGGNN